MTPELEDSKSIFFHDSLAQDDASPYQVWLQNISSCGDIIQMNSHWSSEPFLWSHQSNQIFSQDNPPYDDVPSKPVKLQKNQHFRWYIKKAYFHNIIINCDLDFEESKPIFLKDNLAHNDASPYQVW